MFEKSPNQKTITLKMKRGEVCDLLLACSAISFSLEVEEEEHQKWDDLFNKLTVILNDFDKKQEV